MNFTESQKTRWMLFCFSIGLLVGGLIYRSAPYYCELDFNKKGIPVNCSPIELPKSERA